MSPSRHRAKAPVRQGPLRQSGVSLIELMVSLVIGLMLILGAVTVYMQSRNTYRTNEAAARLQEVARYALDMIEPDIRMAGYWGLMSRSGVMDPIVVGGPADPVSPMATGITNNCGTNWVANLATYVEGRDNGNYNLTCAGTNVVNWADVLVIRRANVAIAPLTANRLQTQSIRGGITLFRNGALPTGYDAVNSETHDLVVNTYYISEVLPSPGGVRQWELRRKSLNGLTIADDSIIRGIEDLQVQYGVDVTGPDGSPDGNADQYFNAGAALDALPAGTPIVTVRVWLMVVSEDIEVGFADATDYAYANQDHNTFSDSRRRLVVSKTIQIRNSAPVPEAT